MDRAKAPDSQIRLFRGEVAYLKGKVEQASRVAMREGEMRRLSGEVEQAEGEKEAWDDRASALREKSGRQPRTCQERGKQRDLQDECGRVREVVGALRKAGTVCDQFGVAKADAGVIERELEEVKRDMQRERSELDGLRGELAAPRFADAAERELVGELDDENARLRMIGEARKEMDDARSVPTGRHDPLERFFSCWRAVAHLVCRFAT